jgi:hypothetical protein
VSQSHQHKIPKPIIMVVHVVAIILPIVTSLIQCSSGFIAKTRTRTTAYSYTSRRIEVVPLVRLSSSRTTRTRSVGGGTGGNGGDEDELSKLISKRNQIKRKKKEEDQVIEERLMESLEPSIDPEKLPEFRTARPSTSSTSSFSSSKSSKKKDAKNADAKEQQPEASASSSFVPVVDYLADYDDENDFHIPNRIGISGAAWGDVSQGFVKTTTGKLSKRMLKAGMFNAGDIQVAITKSLAGGITLIETGPKYGAASRAEALTSEHILAQSLKDCDES